MLAVVNLGMESRSQCALYSSNGRGKVEEMFSDSPEAGFWLEFNPNKKLPLVCWQGAVAFIQCYESKLEYLLDHRFCIYCLILLKVH